MRKRDDASKKKLRYGGTPEAEPSVRPNDVAVDALPRSDPAYPIVAEILRVVPASRWAFARLRPDGDLERLLASNREPGEPSQLRIELQRQRSKARTGPRIAAALGPLGDYASGVTLLFADASATFGILTLLRTEELGPFTSSEVSMLTFALAATSERLSALRLHPDGGVTGPPPSPTPPKDEPSSDTTSAYYVLDRDLEIVLAWNSAEQQRVALTGLHTRVADRLPAILESTVRDLTEGWNTGTAGQPAGIARPVPFLVVRTQPMTGPTGLFVGVRIDRLRPPDPLSDAGVRFHISPRELQVLALLLDGAHLDEIGKRLYITSSTVQDHIRKMVEKTGSRNRTELIARVLGWSSSAENAFERP